MDRLSDLPLEIKSLIFQHVDARDIIRCQRISKSWLQCLSDPHLLRNVALKYTPSESLGPSEEAAAFEVTSQYYKRALKRAHNFHSGSVTGSLRFALPPLRRGLTYNPRSTYINFLFFAERLLVIDVKSSRSHIKVHELQIPRVSGMPPTSHIVCKLYQHDEEHELSDFKCSEKYLACVAADKACYIWRRLASKQERPIKLTGNEYCCNIAVSDEMVIMMNRTHTTIWDAGNGSTARFSLDNQILPDSDEFGFYYIMIESKRRTFVCVHWGNFTSWIICRRYDMRGQLLNHFTSRLNVNRLGQGQKESECFKRQPDGTYLIYHDEFQLAQRHLALIYFDPERFEIFQRQSKISLRGKYEVSMLVDRKTAWYCADTARPLYVMGQDAEGPWILRATLQPPRSMKGKGGRLFGNEKMMFLVRGKWCWAMWFD